MIWLLALRLSVTAKASTAPAASSTRASLTDMPTGPWTLSDVEWFSLRPSSVQMAPALFQLVVSGSVMLTPPLPSGSTVTVQFWLLPWVFRCAFLMSAPLTLNAWSRIRA